MDNAEINALKIADFLENKMPPEDEKAFMAALSNDDALRQQYEEELLIGSIISGDTEIAANKKDLFFQPADEHINMIEKAIEKTGPSEKKMPLLHQFHSYRKIAAIALLFIAGTLIFFLVKSKLQRSDAVAVVNPIEKKVIIDQTTQTSTVAKNIETDSIFEAFYKPYSAKNDPVEISNLLAYYTSGKHEMVINATDADLQQMGTSKRKNLLKNYLRFYKGLAYLAKNDAPKAVLQFGPIVKQSINTNPPFFDAQWYYALSLLKIKDIKNVSAILRNILQSNSPFKSNAQSLMKQLDV